MSGSAPATRNSSPVKLHDWSPKRRDRLPFGHARPLDRAGHRCRTDPGRGDRGEARVSRHRRHHRSSGGYDGAIADFYDECAARLSVHLDADRTVVVLCEGDPLFYGSYMYLHDRLSKHYAAEVIPGVTSFSAAAAASAEPLVRRTDVLTILPGTLPEPELARRLADTDGAVIMKLGRTFESVRNALEQTGRLDDAVYVERATMAGQRIVAAATWTPIRCRIFR